MNFLKSLDSVASSFFCKPMTNTVEGQLKAYDKTFKVMAIASLAILGYAALLVSNSALNHHGLSMRDIQMTVVAGIAASSGLGIAGLALHKRRELKKENSDITESSETRYTIADLQSEINSANNALFQKIVNFKNILCGKEEPMTEEPVTMEYIEPSDTTEKPETEKTEND